MKVVNSIFLLLLYVLVFITSWFSSDSFILSLKQSDNIYFSNSHLTDIIIVLIIILGIFILINRFWNVDDNFRKAVTDTTNNKLERIIILSSFGLIILFIYGVILSMANGVYLNMKDITLYKYRYYIYSVSLLFILLRVSLNKNEINKILNFFIIINLIKCCSGIYNYIKGDGFDFLVLGKVVFAEGDILLNITYALAISFAMFLSSRHKLIKVKYLVAIIVFIGTISVSMRRTTLLSIVTIFIINMIFISFKNKMKIIVLSFITVVSMFSLLSFGDFRESNFSLDNLMMRFESMNIFSNYKSDETLLNDNGHIDDILDALDNVKEHPIIGKGLYTPVNRYRVQWQTSLTYFHNGFLACWIQMGIAGVLVYIIMIGAIVILLLRLIMGNSGYIKNLCIAFLCIAVSNIFQTNVAGSLYDFPVININYFILLTLILSISKFENNNKMKYKNTIK